jgi:predicted nucleic acid-binding protein
VIVIDASALAAYLLKEEDLKFEQYFREDIFCIDLIVKEVANALLIAYRRDIIDKNALNTMYKALLKFMSILNIESQTALIDDSLDVALRRGLTIYDSLYIALAKKLGARLLSLDIKQKKAAEEKGVGVLPA